MATAPVLFHDNPAIRDELLARVDQVARDWRLLSVGELGRRIDAIRSIGRANGMTAVQRIAGGLADRLAADGRGVAAGFYLEGLRAVIAADPFDRRAGDAFLAAAGTRIA
jgi:hypothetical protein